MNYCMSVLLSVPFIYDILWYVVCVLSIFVRLMQKLDY